MIFIKPLFLDHTNPKWYNSGIVYHLPAIVTWCYEEMMTNRQIGIREDSV